MNMSMSNFNFVVNRCRCFVVACMCMKTLLNIAGCSLLFMYLV